MPFRSRRPGRKSRARLPNERRRTIKPNASALLAPPPRELEERHAVTIRAPPTATTRGRREPVMREVPWPKVPPKGALIQIGACGVCGTDQHILKGHWPKPLPWPFTLGHELAGVIVEIGVRAEDRPHGQADRRRLQADAAALHAVRLLRLVQALSRAGQQVPHRRSTTAAISASTSRRICGAAGPSTSTSTTASCPAPRSTSCPTT